jgi:hypothetical protein
MEVDWLETVTSVVYLGGMGIDWLQTLTGLTQSLQSFIWGMGIDWLDTLNGFTQSLQSIILGVWGLTGHKLYILRFCINIVYILQKKRN